jgi:hypothetical protein
MMAAKVATAQYQFNPNNADEQMPGIRYFGSAKDEHGSLVPGVVVRLDTPKLEYVLFTDAQGRFHMMLDVSVTADVVSASCSKPGFQLVRVTKRNGIGPRPSVQVDCVMRRAAAG